MTAPVLFLGLDLSLRATGVALITPDRTVVDYFVPEVGTLKGSNRVDTLEKSVMHEVDSRPGTRFIVAIEGYAMGTLGRKYDIAEYTGAVKLALLRHRGCIALIVPPKTLKQFATGSGAAEKPEMVRRACEQFGVRGIDDNEADVLHLADTARAWWFKTPLDKTKTLAMAKILPAFPMPFPRPDRASGIRKRTPVHKF
jgi:Holliday junction resolvasome RuvABC endonuclease subunit